MKTKIEKMFGSYVLGDDTLKKYLPKKVYKEYLNTKMYNAPLSKNCAKNIANAIKKWAIHNDATHYTHWFLPLNNKSAEKQVAFIEIDSKGKMLEDFSAKDLIKGEADASSFPNGGQRLTFEARGYTVWDYTSPVFIKEDSCGNKVVYIPTAFCSYDGTALDEKTPLLRATQSLNMQVLSLLNKLGYDDVTKVEFNAGVEQEYFLIESKVIEERIDIRTTGHTLLGAKPLKSQAESSHYFGKIENTISKFMNEVNAKLWKMGVTAKLQHNEVAPCQYEFVPIFNCVNIANDQNQLIMETLSDMAKKYGLTVLFHEKPFDCTNGSGKHENWSISTNTGLNLFDANLGDKLLFATFFVGMVVSIDKYYSLLRQATAYYSNDLRLGGDEAPPSLISIFASDYILNYIKDVLDEHTTINNKSVLNTGVKSLPLMERDYCDRNRTSPFAFTGNKFEFRMPGSSQSVAWPSTCVCTILADTLMDINSALANSTNVREDLRKLLKKLLVEHSRIIFNGNGYDDSWKKEAKSRGLVEYRDTVSTFDILTDEKILTLFSKTGVLNEDELNIRNNTVKNTYFANVVLDAKTMVYMLDKEILPTIMMLKNKHELYGKTFGEIYKGLIGYKRDLESYLTDFEKSPNKKETARVILDKLLSIKNLYNSIENLIPASDVPFPDFNEILYPHF